MTYKGCGKEFGWVNTSGIREPIICNELQKCPGCTTDNQDLCENCGKKINVPETALKLCDDCFNEKCECGHIRAKHVDNNGSCIYEFHLQHKTKRGEFCPCKKFILEEKK